MTKNAQKKQEEGRKNGERRNVLPASGGIGIARFYKGISYVRKGKRMELQKKVHVIKKVVPGSIAEELEIEAGDRLLSIDGAEIEDIFDYQFLIQDSYIEILVEKPAACEKIGVCNLAVLLQIVQMPLPPCAYRLFFFGW